MDTPLEIHPRAQLPTLQQAAFIPHAMSLKLTQILPRVVVRGRTLLLTSSLSTKPTNKTLAIRREESSVWERRAPINPNHVESLVRKGINVLVQPSTRRAYSMPEYERAGAIITDEIEEADVIIGKHMYSI